MTRKISMWVGGTGVVAYTALFVLYFGFQVALDPWFIGILLANGLISMLCLVLDSVYETLY